MKVYKYRHRNSWDLTSVTNRDHRQVLQEALNACDYPFSRIRRKTGTRIPVTVSDLSRYATDPKATHEHYTADNGDSAHGLTGEIYDDTQPGRGRVGTRRAALGLFWLPTIAHEAGRVEVDHRCFDQPNLAREVFLAEAAHAVDYGAMSVEQRRMIYAAYHEGSETPHDNHGWFEESGSDNYWAWVGESFMSGFMRAFAPSLPRPLETAQPWIHPTTSGIADTIRTILK